MNETLMMLKTEHWSHPCNSNHVTALCKPFPKKLTSKCVEKIEEFEKEEAKRIQERTEIVDRKKRQHVSLFRVVRTPDKIEVRIKCDTHLKARRTVAAAAAGSGEIPSSEWVTQSFEMRGREGPVFAPRHTALSRL